MPKRLILLIIALMCGAHVAQAEDAKFTALFVLNFAKYIDWPPSAVEGDFIITVLGDDPVTDELKTIAEKTKVGEHTIVVKTAPSIDKVDKCHILYISPDKSGALASALTKFASSNTLVVTNHKGLAESGAAINIAMIDGKQRYEINPESLKKSGLVPKPVLFKLGKVVGS